MHEKKIVRTENKERSFNDASAVLIIHTRSRSRLLLVDFPIDLFSYIDYIGEYCMLIMFLMIFMYFVLSGGV